MHNLELDFKYDNSCEVPYPPRAHICVNFTTGDRFITQTCMTISEFDGEIDRLIKELERIRSLGRAKFKAIKPQ